MIGVYLVLIKSAEKVGEILGHTIWKATKIEIEKVSIESSDPNLASEQVIHVMNPIF